MIVRRSLAALPFLLRCGAALAESEIETGAGMMVLEPVASGLSEPWAIGFLPDGAFLVTEREGRLKLFAGPGRSRQR